MFSNITKNNEHDVKNDSEGPKNTSSRNQFVPEGEKDRNDKAVWRHGCGRLEGASGGEACCSPGNSLYQSEPAN